MAKIKTKSKIGLIITIIVLIFGVAILAYISGIHHSNLQYQPNYSVASTVYTTIPQTYTITLFSQGQVFSINPGAYEFVNFTIPQGAYSINVTGSYTSQGKVEAAILTQTQYGAFTQNPAAISSSQYYYGDTQGSTINAQLSPGSYTVVFYDPGLITQDTISVVNQVTAKYTS